MARNVVFKPLGLVLRKAGLVSSEQVEKALKESLVLPKCKIGEILAIRGWIKPETADFFAEIWPRALAAKKLQPLGQYLKAAGLINDQQIAQILEIQQNNRLNFGKIAVNEAIISQTTLDFFLEHLDLIKTEQLINSYSESVALELDRIESYLLQNQKCEPVTLLQKYDKIRQQGKIIAKGDLAEQELLASGIVVLDQNLIRIAKPNYLANFDADWLEKELANLQPYNQIRLKMFDLEKKVGIPYKIFNAVNYWTEQQPFLNQKLYQLIKEQSYYIPPGKETIIVEELSYKYIIDNWEQGTAAKHLKAIRDRLINNGRCSASALLKTYKKIWQLKEINADNSIEQIELLRIGLIKLNNHRVSVSNLIYQAVFDRQWITEQLTQIEHIPLKLQKPSKKQLHNVSNKASLFKKSNILPIAVVSSFLVAIPLMVILINQPDKPSPLSEQGNYLLENKKAF